jgi:hypothetical protein
MPETGTAFAELLRRGQELTMTVPRYLPANRTKVRSLHLGPISVRTSGDRELGTLMGFLIDPRDGHVRSLVMEVVTVAGVQHVELPMVSISFDADSHALRVIEPGVPSMIAFRPESVSPVEEDDLWVPFFHTAA